MTLKKQGEGFFIGTANSEVPDIERGDLQQALKKAPLFLAIIFSYFCVFLAEQWNHDVIASSKTGILPNCPTDRYIFYVWMFPREVEAQSAERSEFIISSSVCEPRVGPSEQQSRSFHLYLYISDGVRHDVIQ